MNHHLFSTSVVYLNAAISGEKDDADCGDDNDDDEMKNEMQIIFALFSTNLRFSTSIVVVSIKEISHPNIIRIN